MLGNKLIATYGIDRRIHPKYDRLWCRVKMSVLSIELDPRAPVEFVDREKQRMLEKANDILRHDFDMKAIEIRQELLKLACDGTLLSGDFLHAVFGKIGELRETIPQAVLDTAPADSP